MARRLGDITVTARTRRVKPPLEVHTILQIKREKGNVMRMQNFVSVDELREYWEEW